MQRFSSGNPGGLTPRARSVFVTTPSRHAPHEPLYALRSTTGLAGSAVLRAPAARRTPAGGNLTAAFLEVTEP